MAQDLAHRYQLALFVLNQVNDDCPAAAALLTSCVEIIRAGSYALLAVSLTAPAAHPPRRVLIAANHESFALILEAESLRPLLALPDVKVVVAHMSSDVEDKGCVLALRAVHVSGGASRTGTAQLSAR